MIHVKMWPILPSLLLAIAPVAWSAPVTPEAIDAPRLELTDVSEDEAEFILAVHSANIAEIRAGTLARFRGQASGVSDYGKMLVEDHLRAEGRLIRLVGRDILSLLPLTTSPEVTSLTARHREVFTRLLTTPRDEFDKTFAKEMYDAHEEMVEKVRDYIPLLEREDLKEFAQELLVSLTMHRDHALRLMQ